MKRDVTVWIVALAAIAATGCGSIFDDDDDDIYVGEQCWAEVYQDARYVQTQPWTRLQGPVELDSLTDLVGKDWNDRISSIRVGPDAVVQIYEHEDFRGEVREYDVGRFIDNLEDDGMNDKVSSIRIRCR